MLVKSKVQAAVERADGVQAKCLKICQKWANYGHTEGLFKCLLNLKSNLQSNVPTVFKPSRTHSRCIVMFHFRLLLHFAIDQKECRHQRRRRQRRRILQKSRLVIITERRTWTDGLSDLMQLSTKVHCTDDDDDWALNRIIVFRGYGYDCANSVKCCDNQYFKNGPIPASFLFIFVFSTCHSLNSNLNW